MKNLDKCIEQEVNKQLRLLEAKEILNTFPNIDEHQFRSYLDEAYRESLNEMARINVDEFKGFFPHNKFRLQIWSNDHNPPHFHVISDDWDIRVEISNGEILSTKKIGKNSKIYTYVQKYIKKWLNDKCAINPTQTNRQAAIIAWRQNNS